VSETAQNTYRESQKEKRTKTRTETQTESQKQKHRDRLGVKRSEGHGGDRAMKSDGRVLNEGFVAFVIRCGTPEFDL
jgi:hypothetical protein